MERRKQARKRQRAAKPTAAARLQALQRENLSLRKTVDALIARVEQGLNDRKDSFAIFETAARLEETVQARTEQLEALNEQLTHELQIRQEIEAALKIAKQQADEANQVKSRFLAAASHDLRQPLSSAFLFLESLDERNLSVTNHEFVNKTKIALSSLNDLLGTLLDITKLELGGIEPRIHSFRISEVLTAMVSEYTKVAAAAGLELRCASSTAVVRSDPRLLQSVLRNYISNAIRYTPSGRILIGCRRKRRRLEVMVYDTGIGIAADQMEKIFEAYHQIESAVEQRREVGMGLGLSIVDRIVKMLGLERRVLSTQGRGSMFSVLVPYGRRPVRNPVNARSVAERTSLVGKVVVVIDDHRDILEGMMSLLRKWGCIAVAARDAVGALTQLMSQDLIPDLIISDYHLGGGAKGDAAIQDIYKELKRTIPAFLITSDPDPALRESLKAGGFGVLTKPLNLAKLRALIDQKLISAGRTTARKKAAGSTRHTRVAG